MTRVWDPGIRMFHWLLAVAVSVSGFTGFVLGRTALAWHLIAGIAVAIAVAWRIVWGLFGPTYARFSSFAYSPVAVLAHIRALRAATRPRHLGHNPLGAMMVFALLAVLTAAVVTGTLALGGVLKQGPLRSFLSYALGEQALSTHNVIAILLLVMIAAHLAGVAFESWRGKENLVSAMLTGHKAVSEHDEAAVHSNARPVVALATTLAVLAASTGGTIALSGLPGHGVPPAQLDPDLRAAMRLLPPCISPEPGAGLDMERDHLRSPAPFRRGRFAGVRRCRAYPRMAYSECGRALGHAAIPPPAGAGCRRITPHHGHSRLAAHAPGHP